MAGIGSQAALAWPNPQNRPKTTAPNPPLQGNGVIVGLGICGVVLSATSSAATLMGDLRTGYICLASPRAMFAAQLVGQLVGAVLTPLAFMLFYKTGQVNVPGGPYPAPFADIYRGEEPFYELFRGLFIGVWCREFWALLPGLAVEGWGERPLLPRLQP